MNKQWSLFSIGLNPVKLSWAESWTKCVDPMLELLLDFDEISEKGRNIYEWNEINPILLDIDLPRTHRNEPGKSTFRRFGISISINIQYWLLLSNVTLRGLRKLPPLELMECRLGRSRFNHSILFHYYFASLVNMIHHHRLHKVPNNRVESIVVKEDLFDHFIHSHSILSIIVDNDSENALLPSIIDSKLGRSNHSIVNIISIPRITNELQ